MRKLTKRSVAIVAGSVLAVAGGTAAFAYATGWFKGDATVGATASTITNVHVEFQISNSADKRLFPGRVVALPTTTVENPNDYPVQINTIVVQSVASTAAPGCTQEKAGLVFGAVPVRKLNPGTNTNVALGTITMSNTADPVCSGADLLVKANMTGEIAPA